MDADRPGVNYIELTNEKLRGNRGVLVNVVSYSSHEANYQFSIGVLDPRSGKVKVVEEDGGNALYSPTGHLLFSRRDALLAAPFDLTRRKLRGPPVAVWDGLYSPLAFFPAQFSITRDGSLFYQPGRAGPERQISFLDASGRLEPWSTEPRAVDWRAEMSPDGRRFACMIINARAIDEVWIGSVDHPELHRLGTDPKADCEFPMWSPDGKRIAYARHGKDANDGIYVQDVDGGAARRIFQWESGQTQYLPTSWLPDGSALLLWHWEPAEGKSSLARLDLAGGRPDSGRALPLLPSAFNLSWARISPNGRVMAYISEESGRPVPFVVELRSDGSTGTPVQLATEAGAPGVEYSAPFGGEHWSRDGKTLFVQDGRNRVMKVSVSLTPQLSVSAPTEVFDADKLGIAMWSPLPDGRFLVGLKVENEGEITRYNLVLHWTEELKRRMQAAR